MITAPRRLPTRKDAVANRERLLAGAEEYFGEKGIDAPLHGLAEHVGVGVGTLYRNFATHADLVRALHDRIMERFDEMTEKSVTAESAWDRIVESLFGTAALLVDFPATGAILRRQFENDPDHRPTLKYHHVLVDMVEQAIADGDLRPDITPIDVSTIPFTLGGLPSIEKENRHGVAMRQVAIILDGLRAHPHEPSVLPPQVRIAGAINEHDEG